MKIGNISFNTEANGTLTLAQFKEMYAGKLTGVDITAAYVRLNPDYKPAAKPKAKRPSQNAGNEQ